MVMVIENILRYLLILFLYDNSHEGSQQRFPKSVIKGNMVMVIENILRYLLILFLYDNSHEGSQQRFPKSVIKRNIDNYINVLNKGFPKVS